MEEQTYIIPDVCFSKECAQNYERNKRMQKIQREMAARALELLGLKKGKILDAGCGTGFGTEVIRAAGFEVIGIDISEPMLDIAKKKGFDVRKADFTNLPFPDSTFDGIICISSLQWIYGRSAQEVMDKFYNTAREFFRVLKKRGAAVVQFYPKTPQEFDLAVAAFRDAGFAARIAIDFPDTRKQKKYIVLQK